MVSANVMRGCVRQEGSRREASLSLPLPLSRASRMRFSSSAAYPAPEVSEGSLASACFLTSCIASSRALSVFSREYRISFD